MNVEDKFKAIKEWVKSRPQGILPFTGEISPYELAVKKSGDCLEVWLGMERRESIVLGIETDIIEGYMKPRIEAIYLILELGKTTSTNLAPMVWERVTPETKFSPDERVLVCLNDEYIHDCNWTVSEHGMSWKLETKEYFTTRATGSYENPMEFTRGQAAWFARVTLPKV